MTNGKKKEIGHSKSVPKYLNVVDREIKLSIILKEKTRCVSMASLGIFLFQSHT
jgi:hypothetical protein